MGDRRKLEEQINREQLETIDKRAPARDREWEAKQRDGGIVVTYRGIPRGAKDAIKAIADDMGVRVGDVARALLEHGIADYEAGTLNLEAHVRPDRTLYLDG